MTNEDELPIEQGILEALVKAIESNGNLKLSSFTQSLVDF